MIELLYFASLREALNMEKEQLELPANINTILDLKSHLSTRGDIWAETFGNNSSFSLLVSVNQQMADDLTSVNDGDEIAFFPPVTGG